MNALSHHTTAARDRVPMPRKLAYGTGMIGYALLIQGYMQFYNPVFNDTLGLSPVMIGWVIAITRLWDAVTDPFMGSISDNTRSKWGRRRPWIALGAVLCGLSFVLIWWFPEGRSENFYFGWLLVTSLIFYVAFTIYSVPYIALGMELSPDYHERGSIMAIRTVLQQGGFFIISSLYWLTSMDCFDDRAEGMKWNSLWVGALIVVVILIPAFFSREQQTSNTAAANGVQKKIPLWRSMKETLSCWPFLLLSLITIVSLLGLMMVGSLGYYVTIYHMFDGDKGQTSGSLMTLVNYTIPVSTVVAVPLLQRLSVRLGKRKTMIAAFAVALVGTLLKWPCYTPVNPYLSIIPSVLLGVGSAAAYVFVNAMIPDAVDEDELRTGERREGMFSAVYSWMFKIGAAVALLLAGYVLSGTGFDAALEGPQPADTIFWMRVCFTGIPAIALAATIVLAYLYPITEEKAYAIRQQLEARRGASMADAS
ncbi:MFS transporter [Ruficoccus amylovorans]|uniref:MFS transporter n=1 Tax=Ruficoccus amylovorans TaxID=1804625 RepID=A0A842HKS2_9BACT|nr:MFS transporter [Ruficoccus amylovorans]MBC2595741.1 MFS transporter [Ruficoccus amylovorans]